MEQQARSGRITRRVGTGLYAIRWAIIISVFLESRLKFASVHVNSTGIAYAVAAVALLTLLGRLAPEKWTRTQGKIIGVVADIAFVTLVIYFSDGIQSPFYPLYFLTLISAALACGTMGALIYAGIIGLLSLGMEIAEAGGRVSDALVLHDVVRTFPYLFLIAAITGAMRDRFEALADTASRLRADRAATEREMEVARRVQLAQLPDSIPRIEGAEIVVVYKPAREVGGDLYEFVPVEENRLGVAVADVSGKGVPAALLVSAAKYAVLEHYSEDRPMMMRNVNEHLLAVTTDDSFITMIYGVLSIEDRKFKYVNAGHVPPIVVKHGTGEAVVCLHSDLPLGIAEQFDCAEQHLQLEAGDTLVLYTDGVTDALDLHKDGIDALCEFLGELAGRNLDAWPDEFAQIITNPHHLDDVTLVAIRIK